MSRRDFLRQLAQAGGVSAALASFPPAIRRAQAIPAAQRTRSLQDVEHIFQFALARAFTLCDHYHCAL